MAEGARRFEAAEGLPTQGLEARSLVNGGVYEARRIVAAPHATHGPGTYGGDACVCLLSGSVTFTVDGRPHPLCTRDVLWVPAGALRAFTAGPEGAELLAVHLPKTTT